MQESNNYLERCCKDPIWDVRGTTDAQNAQQTRPLYVHGHGAEYATRDSLMIWCWGSVVSKKASLQPRLLFYKAAEAGYHSALRLAAWASGYSLSRCSRSSTNTPLASTGSIRCARRLQSLLKKIMMTTRAQNAGQKHRGSVFKMFCGGLR